MDKANKIIALRKAGNTIRAISQETGIPRSTVHQIIKRSMDKGVDSFVGWQSLLVHLPVTFFCPSCGKEQNHVYICPLCGKFVPAECETADCCWEGFDLSEVKLGRVIGYPL